MTAPTWPLTIAALRTALGYEPNQGDPDELAVYALAASQEVDRETGRDVDEDRHLLPDGTLPVIFWLAARTTAKLWWEQDKNGPADPNRYESDRPAGPPMGASLPSKVKGWLSKYPAAPGIA